MLSFFFGYRQTGGVPRLYLNLATELSCRNIHFKLICLTNSKILESFYSQNIDFEFIDMEKLNNTNEEKSIDKDDTLIVTYFDPKLYLLKKTNPKLFFWNVFPDYLLDCNKAFGKIHLKKRDKKLINTMHRKKALAFMDDAPIELFKSQLNLDLNPFLLPLPFIIPEKKNEAHVKKEPFNEIRISYIGRAEIWKVNPFIKVLNDLSSLKLDKKIVEIKVVTDNIEYFKQLLTQYISDKTPKIKFYENLTFNELKNLLENEIEINISMGYACLESAILGIPTILLDPSYSLLPEEYKYKWLFQTQNYKLGSLISHNNNPNKDGFTLSDLINKHFNTPKYLETIGEKCKDYVTANHSSSKITDRFLEQIKISNLRFIDIKSNVWRYSSFKNLLNLIKR